MKTAGKNVLLAYGGGSLKRNGLYDKLRRLDESGKNVTDFGGIMPNPTYAKVQEGARLVKENHIDFILAVGGGSVIDCCKIVSVQAKTDEDIWDMQYSQQLFATEFVPMGAVVTASGTGAEQNCRSSDYPRGEETETTSLGRISLFCRIRQRFDEDRTYESGH